MKIRTASFGLALAGGASPVFAHPGHGENAGFVGGLLHPLTGLDHVSAMVMVGVWAGCSGGRSGAAGPLAFVSAMVVGFASGLSGIAIPGAEIVILASVVVLAGMIVVETRAGRGIPVALAVSLIAIFGAAHGFAHGAELPAGGDALAFGSGFVLATAALHITGFAFARAVRVSGFRKPRLRTQAR